MYQHLVKESFNEMSAVLDAFSSEENVGKVARAAALMTESLEKGGQIISCGNGGSLCDAMHFAEELSGRFRLDRRPLAGLALSDVSHMSCVANDFGYDYVFSKQVEALGRPGDLLLGISTSGNSRNVLEAIAAARRAGMKVVGLTGKSGGEMASLCDVEIQAPKTEFSDRAQEIHEKVIHSLVHYIELELGL